MQDPERKHEIFREVVILLWISIGNFLTFRRLTWQFEANLYLDVARLMLSLLHGWFLDDDLGKIKHFFFFKKIQLSMKSNFSDSVCLKRLSLCRPLHQLYFGNISRHGKFFG